MEFVGRLPYMVTPVIAGYGESAYDKTDQKHPLEYMSDAIRAALDDSGLSIDDIDGFASASFMLGLENVVTIGQQFGIDGTWFSEGAQGGASSVSAIVRGCEVIEHNDSVDTILIVAADSFTPDSHMDLVDDFNTGIRNNMAPYGFGGANGLFALIQRRHMHEYGTTRKQLSSVAVTQRAHALKNPRAIFDSPLTTEEYLDARPIVKPIHLYDCVLPCGAGGAIVLTTEEKADETGAEKVYLTAGCEHHDPDPTKPFELSTSLRNCKHIFDDNDLDRDDIDAVQLYDDYPIMVALQLEDLGFCAKGEGGTYIEETDLSITGELPLNTGGGQLSMGQAGAAGGILAPIEAIRQLRGNGGERQVPDCETVLATGFGMVGYGGGLSGSVAVMSNTEVN